MSKSIDYFLRDLPNGIESSREGDKTDIIISGNPAPIILSFLYAVTMSILGSAVFSVNSISGANSCLPGQECLHETQIHFIVVRVIGAGLCLAALKFYFNAIRSFLTKTVIQIDSTSDNLVMFTRRPWGDGKQFNFSVDQIFPVIRRRRVGYSRAGSVEYYFYDFEVYPNKQESKNGVGFFKKNPKVFVVTNWNQDRCSLIKQLILKICEEKQAEKSPDYHLYEEN